MVDLLGIADRIEPWTAHVEVALQPWATLAEPPADIEPWKAHIEPLVAFNVLRPS